MVNSPTPFIVGVHRSFLLELVVPSHVIVVDVDRNIILAPPEGATVRFRRGDFCSKVSLVLMSVGGILSADHGRRHPHSWLPASTHINQPSTGASPPNSFGSLR